MSDDEQPLTLAEALAEIKRLRGELQRSFKLRYKALDQCSALEQQIATAREALA